MNRFTRTITATLALALAGLLGQVALAGGGNCDHCGKKDDTCKVCRLVTEKSTIKVDCWASECKDICVPGPSKRGAKHEVSACADDGCGKGKKGDEPVIAEGANTCPKRVVWFDWCPGKARVHTTKHLLRKTVEVPVTTYKWVLEDVCDKCDKKADGATIEPGTEDLVPEPPPTEARLKYGNPHHLPVSFERTSSVSPAETAKVFAGLLK